MSVWIQEKEGSVTLKYPMLTKCNYAAWAIKMEVFMMAQGVWEAIESPETEDNRNNYLSKYWRRYVATVGCQENDQRSLDHVEKYESRCGKSERS